MKSKVRAKVLSSGTADSSSPLRMSWMYFFAGIILLTVAMMFVSFPAGIFTVYGTNISSNFGASTPVYSLSYDLLFTRFVIPISSTLGEVFVVFLAIYFFFFIFAAKQAGGFVRALRASLSDGYVALFSSPLTGMIVLLGATSLATTILDTLQMNTGISTGNLTGDPFALLVDFTIAPLLEESAFRLILIGVPVFILSLLLFRESSPWRAIKVLWRPSSAWDKDEDDPDKVRRTFEGSGVSIFQSSSSSSLAERALKPIVYVFLIVSSFLFGYAHFAFGSGWGPGKISEAALAGFALGYLYVKYGFHASVLLHFSINYVGSIFSFLAQGLWGVSWTSNTGSPLDYVPSIVIIFLLGVPSLLLVVNELLKKVVKPRREKSLEQVRI